MRKQLVLTAVGRDRPGIVEEFTKLILHFDGNIEASRMVRLGGDMAMLVFVSAPEDRVFELRKAVDDLHYTKFDVLTRLSEVDDDTDEPQEGRCTITVLGADHMGIINQVAQYLSEQGINLESMHTEVSAAPMSGTPLFTMSAEVVVPPRLAIEDLREAMEFIGDEMGIDTKVFAKAADLHPA
ncbi:MAG: ACT domain-containing protein [Thermoanaerobaculales bacterium]|nr:ACT domain-containing protein [Thermoanaerobaculales bacterium]